MDRMHAVVRSVMSPDAGADPLEEYQPAEPDLFAVFVEFEIGPSEGEGADLFGLTVCSPRWILERQRSKGFEFVQATLVVDRWDLDLVVRAVCDLCARSAGSDWAAIAASLSRLLRWEFADYRP